MNCNKTTKIMIADDNVDWSNILEKYLTNNMSNIEIIANVSDGDSEVEIAKKLKPNIIITDIVRKKGISGLEAIKRCKELNLRDTKFIVQTATYDIELINELEHMEIRDVLIKPFDMKKIIEVIEKIHMGDKIYEKISMIVAHSDSKVIDRITSVLENLDIIDVIYVSTNGFDTYKKILEKKPEMVFLDYKIYPMSGFDIMINAKGKLQEKTPIFNIIADIVPEEELKFLCKYLGRKINALVRDPIEERTKSIMVDYKEYMKTKAKSKNTKL